MADYTISNGELYLHSEHTSRDELRHYGVVGMKWGVHRARRKNAKNEKLRKKALSYDIKSQKLEKKAEKIHAERDLGESNKAAKKAANYSIKADKFRKKALNASSDAKRLSYERKASVASYKSSVQKTKADKMSKLVGYGAKAMRYSIKSDEVAQKAAKARMKIAKNEAWVAHMDKKVSKLSGTDVSRGKSYMDAVMEKSRSAIENAPNKK